MDEPTRCTGLETKDNKRESGNSGASGYQRTEGNKSLVIQTISLNTNKEKMIKRIYGGCVHKPTRKFYRVDLSNKKRLLLSIPEKPRRGIRGGNKMPWDRIEKRPYDSFQKKGEQSAGWSASKMILTSKGGGGGSKMFRFQKG